MIIIPTVIAVLVLAWRDDPIWVIGLLVGCGVLAHLCGKTSVRAFSDLVNGREQNPKVFAFWKNATVIMIFVQSLLCILAIVFPGALFDKGTQDIATLTSTMEGDWAFSSSSGQSILLTFSRGIVFYTESGNVWATYEVLEEDMVRFRRSSIDRVFYVAFNPTKDEMFFLTSRDNSDSETFSRTPFEFTKVNLAPPK